MLPASSLLSLVLLLLPKAMESAKVPILTVPARDPEAEAALRTDYSEPVSATKAGKFFQIWDGLEAAGGTKTDTEGESHVNWPSI